jgi:predicted alpha/beta hydrolase
MARSRSSRAPRGASNGVADAVAHAAPRVESLDIRTSDGWSLRADVREPAGEPIGVAVLAHAFMARRSEFHRPNGASLAAFLVASGWRVVAFDFRGHGDSHALRGDESYGYDDFVLRDLAAVCEFAREQCEAGTRLVVVGHSLGGHTALAAQGIGAIQVDAVVGIGAAPPFLAAHEPSRVRWLAKRAALRSMVAVARGVGRFPARAMGLGSDDEALACCEDFDRYARSGRWESRDGRIDYLAALGRVRVPVLQVVSEGDRFECVPECGELFAAASGGPREIVRVTRSDGGGPPPTHMGLVTSQRVQSVWSAIEAWMRRVRMLSTPDGLPRPGKSFPG